MQSEIDATRWTPTGDQIQRRDGVVLWSDIGVAVHYLISVMVYNHFTPKKIMALSRGGNIAGTMLSHYYDAELHCLRVESYKDQKAGKVRFIQPYKPSAVGLNQFQMLGALAEEWDKEDTLIVDDLWDTGETMKVMGMAFPKCLRGTLFFKSEACGRDMPPINFPGLWVPKDLWLKFPWEIGSAKDNENASS